MNSISLILRNPIQDLSRNTEVYLEYGDLIAFSKFNELNQCLTVKSLISDQIFNIEKITSTHFVIKNGSSEVAILKLEKEKFNLNLLLVISEVQNYVAKDYKYGQSTQEEMIEIFRDENKIGQIFTKNWSSEKVFLTLNSNVPVDAIICLTCLLRLVKCKMISL